MVRRRGQGAQLSVRLRAVWERGKGAQRGAGLRALRECGKGAQHGVGSCAAYRRLARFRGLWTNTGVQGGKSGRFCLKSGVMDEREKPGLKSKVDDLGFS